MVACTHCPLEVWTSSVTRVDVAGHTQFSANMAYLNSSSHTTWSDWKGYIATIYYIKLKTIMRKWLCFGRLVAFLHLPANLTWNLFSGLRIWTYRGQFGAKSFAAQALKIVWWSCGRRNSSISFTQWLICKSNLNFMEHKVASVTCVWAPKSQWQLQYNHNIIWISQTLWATV